MDSGSQKSLMRNLLTCIDRIGDPREVRVRVDERDSHHVARVGLVNRREVVSEIEHNQEAQLGRGALRGE